MFEMRHCLLDNNFPPYYIDINANQVNKKRVITHIKLREPLSEGYHVTRLISTGVDKCVSVLVGQDGISCFLKQYIYKQLKILYNYQRA